MKKEHLSKREAIIAVGLLTIAMVACGKEITGQIILPTTEPSVTSGVIYPGETITLTSTLKPLDSPVPLETITPTPQESCLIDGTVFAEGNRHPDGGYRYPADMSKIDKPLNQWNQAERTTIVDAAGNSIYDGVGYIANSGWVSDNKLNYAGTWIGRGCGYGLMFEDQNGQDVWATNVLGMAMGRPDGNGLGFGAQPIPNPGIEGRMELIVGREQTAVWVRGTDQIIGKYDPVTQVWNFEQAYRPTEAYELYELSSEQLAAKHLYGSGFEINAEYEGVPVNFTAVTSEGNLIRYNQTRGCMLNTEMAKYGYPAEDRIAKMVFLGHYVGYLRDNRLSETQFTFEEYMANLKAGRDMGYAIYGIKTDQDTGEFLVDPLKPVEYVVTESETDPNGRGTALLNDNASRRGYIQLENGGLRIIQQLAGSASNMFNFCIVTGNELSTSLLSLGGELGALQGWGQFTYPGFVYPITKVELENTVINLQIYYNSNKKISSNVFAAP